jgi:hypothetical protein
MKRTRVVIAVLMIVGATPTATTALAAGRSRQPHSCMTTSGATWKWRALKGDEYNVHASGATCAFARLWSARLSYKPLLGAYSAHSIAGGPKGWACGFPYPFPFTRAWAGACRKGKAAFTWLPQLPKSAIGP